MRQEVERVAEEAAKKAGEAAKEARKVAKKAAGEAGKKAKATLKRTRHELHWAGPVILTTLGFIWLLHGYKLLPAFMNVPWLGGILMTLGLLRLGMYFLGYY